MPGERGRVPWRRRRCTRSSARGLLGAAPAQRHVPRRPLDRTARIAAAPDDGAGCCGRYGLVGPPATGHRHRLLQQRRHTARRSSPLSGSSRLRIASAQRSRLDCVFLPAAALGHGELHWCTMSTCGIAPMSLINMGAMWLVDCSRPVWRRTGAQAF